MAPWWPSDTTKALQQRWWHSSTTSLGYCWCSMNKPPCYKFKLPCVACPALKGPSPMLSSKISFSSPKSRPLLVSHLFCLTAVRWNCLAAILFRQEWEKVKVNKGRNWGLERRWRKDGSVPDTWVTYVGTDEMCRKTKWESPHPWWVGGGCDGGRWACYGMSVSHLFNLLRFTQ